MDALIIAAGFGTRLRPVSDCKPLTPILGIPLLELGIRQSVAAGVRRVVVVTGYQADLIEAELPRLSRSVNIPVVAQRVENWSQPNGHSVIAGAAQIDGDYLLMMADHIFSSTILSNLAQQGRPDRGVTLAIDRRITGPLIDPDDATWVETGDQGCIRSIGKSISAYDAVDCGAFLATPELAAAIEAAIAAGCPGSLSDGMQRLADVGRAATMDVGDAWWIDVDDARAYDLAEIGVVSWLGDIYENRLAEAAK
ncbi:NTP transferase domain-containing protein [Altererythrobacter xixiisoli]|uniref:NTP transferase domain-containing protein n=1 Tax=Croceibacterium xixiisoli TaxID=1476466 RepID=A0A6I4TVD8_9SPHN|nr:NTP transferase domain-containing protein [Croceibacterium xixiisoli]MXO99200.1 NTP transferase domain-containing protein [Croceibacterium xixiisoli]